MDTNNTHNLSQRERVELMAKIQRLEWLLKECIGIEEYELCHQIKGLIQKKYGLLSLNTNQNETE